MYKRFILFTKNFLKCIYFLIIFFIIFLMLCNRTESFPIDNNKKFSNYLNNHNFSTPFIMQQSSSSQQRNLFNLYPNSSRNYNHIPNMMYSRTSSTSRIRRHRIPHQKHHHQPHNQIFTTIYDPKEHRYLDPYEIDNNNLLINRLLKSSRSRTIPSSTQQSAASLDLINDNQYTPSIFQSEAHHHGTNTIQRDAIDTSRAAIEYFLNNRKARATPNHHNNKSATSIHRVQTHHFCPGQDVATRAYLAPIVFEGKVRSMSSNKKPHYAVTFEVKIVYKNQSKFNKPLVKNETIRLHFAHGKGTTCECLDYYSNNNISSTKLSSSAINNNSHHQISMHQQISSSSAAAQQHVHCGNLVKAHLRAGKTYILFVNRLGAHNYTVLGPPVASTNKSVHAVLRVVQNLNSVKPANVSELNDVTLKWGKKLKLVCRTQGFPPPRVHWFKNGTDNFLRLKRVRVQHRRRQSTLVISKVKLEDAGRYECSARGVIGPPITKSAFVRVLNNTRTENIFVTASSADPHPCTEDRAQICMNGGTCMFFSTIGEYACQCANGFNGRRCDQKMPLMTKSTYTSYSCNDKYLC